jgi:RHS repeat-associated protein
VNLGSVLFVARRFAALLSSSLAALSLPASAESVTTSERYFNSASDAVAACNAQPVEYTCGEDGTLYYSFCNNIPAPHGGGGMTRVARVEMLKPGGSACYYYLYYTALKYTYFISRDSACPAGSTFVGPGPNDCVSSTYASHADDNQKGCGGGDGNGGSCSASESGGGEAAKGDLEGNPVNSANGNKTQREVDIVGGNGVPGFVRTYNSFESRNVAYLGIGWTHNWAMRLERTGGLIVAMRPDGAKQKFSGSGVGFWAGEADTKLRLEEKEFTYELAQQNGTIEVYDKMGRLTAVRDARGLVTTVDQSAGILTQVTGPFGHKLVFGYTSNTVSVTDSAGQTVTFTINYSNLMSASYQDGSTRQYLYEALFLPHGLTGIVDGTGTRIATYTYDAFKLVAIGTSRAGGTGAKLISFSVDGLIAQITDSFGRVVTKVRERLFGLNKTNAVSNSVDGKTVGRGYDAAGNVSSITNEEGQTTTFAYDAANRLVAHTRAAGTSIAQTTTTSYADSFFAIRQVASEQSVFAGQSKATGYVYGDTRFPLLPTSITVSGFTPTGAVVSRSISMAYDETGQIAGLNGPRTDVADTVSFERWQCTTAGACGQLRRITNALGQVTTFDSYDGAGRLTQKSSPDGVVTTYTYSARGNLANVTETGGGISRATSFTYDQANRLQSASLPSGQVLTYAYDGADQLLSITDQSGNQVVYAYDTRGNRTSQTVKDAGGTVASAVTMAYNARSYLAAITAAGSTTNIDTDSLGNVLQVQDGRGNTTTNQFDALNRLWKTVNAANGNTTAAFTPGGEVAQLVTPNGATFGFEVDDLGNVLKENSPDRGMVTMGYDGAGNLTSRTDARGVLTSYAYDALNRVISITYPSSAENASYAYDSCGAGRLCQVADASGTRSFSYDGLGRVATETWLASTPLGGHSFTTSYTWTSFDRPATITAPSGRQVAYTYDANGRVTSVSSGGQNIVSGRTYRADGLPTGQTFGNGVVESRDYDTAGRLVTWTIGSIETRSYTYDLAGNVSSISYGGTTKTYGYDSLDRLTSEPGQAFNWDGNGNRLSDAAGSYGYQANSNRMSSSPAGTIMLDAAGNTTTIGNRSFAYSEAGKLVQASDNGTVVGTYVFRADALRAAKTTTTGTTLFHWTVSGELLEESTSAGAPVRSYAWVDGAPVAQWTGVGPVLPIHLHSDHLSTPRVASEAGGVPVWRWDGGSFGQVSPTGSVVVNLRFPGQYADDECGLIQNWHRTYDSLSGRYVQSDPIGLGGGSTTTYGYVNGNPLSYYDTYGLFGMDDVYGAIYQAMGGWAPSQELVDFGGGFGDTVTFGLTKQARDLLDMNSVNQCSNWYAAGEATGIAVDMAIGGVAGLEAAGTRGAGREFSHWIPNRIGGPRSLWNGNYVSTEVHALSDPFRYRFMPKAWKAQNPMPNQAWQQWVRLPNVYKGAGAGAAYGAGGAAVSKNCTCTQ